MTCRNHEQAVQHAVRKKNREDLYPPIHRNEGDYGGERQSEPPHNWRKASRRRSQSAESTKNQAQPDTKKQPGSRKTKTAADLCTAASSWRMLR